MKPMKNERIAVLGAGSWGATLAVLLADNGHEVTLWEFDPKAAATLASTRTLSFLSELHVPPKIQVTNNLSQTLERRSTIICATPSHTVRATMSSVKKTKALDPKAVLVSVSKGLEEQTLKRM